MNINQYLTPSCLHKALKNNTISVGFVVISFLFILKMNLAGLMIFLFTFLAIPFSIYTLTVLYIYDKKGWIYGFIIGLGISFLPMMFYSNEGLFLIVIKFAPLLFFMLYNISLKMKVGEWLIDQEFSGETFGG